MQVLAVSYDNYLKVSEIMPAHNVANTIGASNASLVVQTYVVGYILHNVEHAYGLDEPLLIYCVSSESKSSGCVRSARQTCDFLEM